MNCPNRENCYTHNVEGFPSNHDVRNKYICDHWNGEYCTDEIAGVKEGDSCDINKIRRLKEK